MRTQRIYPRLFGTRIGFALLCLAVLAWTGVAAAQCPAPGTAWAFDIDGILQDAKLDGVGAGALQGGHLTVNNHVVTVPSNNIVLLPANQLTWAELFTQAPAPYTGVATGMAVNDVPTPLTSYEVHVQGNVVPSASSTVTNCQGEYIAGRVFISQQGLNSGSGYINFIDYTTGEFRVGGTPGDATTGARVRLNDPAGKFGRVSTVDQRFTLDPDNPTVRSVTGFPMCIPRVTADPSVAGNPDDAACPLANRPQALVGPAPGVLQFAGKFVMNAPGTGFPDPTIMAPFEVGDYVTFGGTLVADATGTAGPWPATGTAGTYISAHTVTNNVSIYTFPDTNPAYVAIDVTLLGTGGTTVLGINEATIRTRFEGFTTDQTRMIHLYGIDLACDGTVSGNRDWGTIGIDPGPPNGAAQGRWRFRPPCAVFGTDPATIKFDKQCIMNAAGSFLPPTEEVRAVLEALPNSAQISAWTAGAPDCAVNGGIQPCNTTAAGLITGQYHAPISDFIFPEQVVGTPVPPDNFETIPFMANGGYTSTAGTLLGQLNPWPGIPTPPSACAATVPIITSATAAPNPVTAGGTLNLAASATGTAPITFAWSQTAGTAGTFNAPLPGAAAGTWTAPAVAVSETATFQVTATNAAGSASATVSVTVNPVAALAVTATATPLQVPSNGLVNLSAAATGGVPPYTFAWSQTLGPVGTFSATTGTPVTWTAPPVAAPTSATIQVTATDSVGSTASGTVVIGIDPIGAPVISTPIAAQTVTVGGAVSVPVTVTSTNTKANLGLIVSPTTFTNFKVNTVSNVCGTTGCTANFTINFTAPNAAQVITLSVTATDTSTNPAVNSATATATVTVNAVQNPVIAHVTPITVKSGTQVNLPVTVTSANLNAVITLAAVQTTAFPIVPNPPTVSQTGKTCTATLCTFTFNVSFTLTLPTNPLQTTNDVVALTLTATDTSVTPNLVSAPEFTTVTVTPVPDTITITAVEDRTGKQRVIVNATDSIISPNVILTVQPYQCSGGITACPASGTQQVAGFYNPCTGVGCTMTNNGGGLYLITMVGAPRPVCKTVGETTYTTPCTALAITVKSNIGGVSPASVITRIRQ